jgi:hypothetical protein
MYLAKKPQPGGCYENVFVWKFVHVNAYNVCKSHINNTGTGASGGSVDAGPI